jgi:hypothetical protein
VSDPRTFLTSMAVTFGLLMGTFLLYRRTLGPGYSALSGAAVAVIFVLVFGLSRARLGRPGAGSPGFRESLFLGLTVASLALLVGWFAFAR